MDASYRLSALDPSPIAAGSAVAQALRNTLDLARLCQGHAARRRSHELVAAEYKLAAGLASA